MKIYRIEGMDLPKGKRVLTLGSFDGVHLGHLSLIDLVKKKAKEKSIASAVMIFDPRPDEKKPEITSLPQQIRLFRDLGIEELFIVNFTPDFRSLPYTSFLSLLGRRGVEDLVIGPFTCLGRGGEGTAERIKEFCSPLRMNLVVAPPVEVSGERVSSTRIRGLIERGEMEEASLLLSRPHFISGRVVRGLKNGRKMDFPTANLGGMVEGLIPAQGVYFGYFAMGSSLHRAAISVGTNPTVNPASREVKIEANLIDGAPFSLYGIHADIRFLGRLRSQVRFPSFSQLKEAIAKDVLECSLRTPKI
ncbi:MAG: riboflavin biosynthesis protein RibF [Aeriscardovia sp.]|nr:riboflavin biosynthesis protein RibF [Aeriscardovia sp.]